MPSKTKKMRQEKRKKRGGEILLSAHARTSQADILHLDKKAARCMTCKLVCGKFQLFIARLTVTRKPLNQHFSAKSPGANGLSCIKRLIQFANQLVGKSCGLDDFWKRNHDAQLMLKPRGNLYLNPPHTSLSFYNKSSCVMKWLTCNVHVMHTFLILNSLYNQQACKVIT